MKILTGNKVCGAIGFCSFTIVKDYSDYLSQENIADDPFCINYYEENNMFAWAIEASSTYHIDLDGQTLTPETIYFEFERNNQVM